MIRELKRITYVEDELDIREVVRLALENLGGFTLSLCKSGPELLEQAPSFRPDLILLDMMMPEMDGIETFRALKAMPGMAETPVIFITAKAQNHEIEQYKALGAADVIGKPFDPMTLADDIRAIWAGAVQGGTM